MEAEHVQLITTELISDLIKIGLPSLIALVGTISSVVLAIKGHRKDIQIEKLRIENEEEKERNKRKGELIEQISVNLTKLHSDFISYSTFLCAKIETEAEKQSFPDPHRKQLSMLYHNLVDQLHNGINVEAHISLLGNKGIIDMFQRYWSSLNNVPQNLAPNSTDISYDDVTRKIQSLSEKYRAILEHLSKVFLIGER